MVGKFAEGDKETFRAITKDTYATCITFVEYMEKCFKMALK